MAARDNIETPVFAICWVNSRPRPDGRFGIKSIAKVELVLMPRETESNLRCFPDKQIIDAKDVRAENINERIR